MPIKPSVPGPWGGEVEQQFSHLVAMHGWHYQEQWKQCGNRIEEVAKHRK